jgi:hypothetical protein
VTFLLQTVGWVPFWGVEMVVWNMQTMHIKKNVVTTKLYVMELSLLLLIHV